MVSDNTRKRHGLSHPGEKGDDVQRKWQTLSDVICDKLADDQRATIEELCSKSLAADPFVRAYIKERFVLRWCPPGTSLTETPVVYWNQLSLWIRLKLTWKLVRG